MKLKYILVFVFVIFQVKNYGQTSNEDILFSVAEEPVYVSEFLRVYNKNLDLVQDESQKDVDEYLTLYTNYKLKLKEAKALGFHEKPSYQRELGNYRKQLAKSYISDSKVTEALVEEAYERISNDVKANHILVRVDESATPADTLAAYNQVLKLRERALSEGFEKVRKEVHNGKTIYGEELGYFTGFKMVYKFENVAYNTPVGEISQPFRTRFGYHFIKVFDKRKARGERTVAHIMLTLQNKDSLSGNPEERIQEIYKKIQQGEDFEALAKQFSEDKNSAPRGGKLKPFSGGQLSVPIFEEVAFGLDSIGVVSTPFKSKFGWHIVKLYGKKPVAPFQEIKPELEVKVKRDDRSKIIDEALHSKLKKRYNISNEQPALDYFTSILNNDFFARKWVLPEDFSGDKPLVKIGKKQLNYIDFGDYLVKNQRHNRSRTTLRKIAESNYETFLNTNLVKYQEDNLEYENEEFADIVGEYRDGLLLFDLMETSIWNAAKTDSIEVKDFYEANKNKYFIPERINAVVASSNKQKTLKKVSKLLEEGMDLDKIKNLVNSNNKVDVIFTSGIMAANHQALPEDFVFAQGISKIQSHNTGYVVVQVKEILPKDMQSFEDAKGTVISDYQTHKEEKWLNTLRDKYSVIINEAALQTVKEQIKNQ
ncbi:peptidylprolyl isomerase [Hyunsoonleella aestuarii]|uniref:Peptidylprolyl isomerase n=1 Tax=Hyunsoonleella aestuarii TaxID=912802 RepID=A0ABP8E6Z2_9FLAO|nr:peptidylprolyl isomerase [Hyunsoonleella aestuarii]